MYYQTPPSAYYSPQMVQSAPSAPTQQRYYYQPGTPTHPSQLEPVNLSQAMSPQVHQNHSTPHTPVAVNPAAVDPPTIVQTPNRQRVVIWNYCQFCQNNREPEAFYKSHILRDQDGRVICPVLRAYNCPICNNGGGDKAHTKSYCPQLRTAGRLTRKHWVPTGSVFSRDPVRTRSREEDAWWRAKKSSTRKPSDTTHRVEQVDRYGDFWRVHYIRLWPFYNILHISYTGWWCILMYNIIHHHHYPIFMSCIIYVYINFWHASETKKKRRYPTRNHGVSDHKKKKKKHKIPFKPATLFHIIPL